MEKDSNLKPKIEKNKPKDCVDMVTNLKAQIEQHQAEIKKLELALNANEIPEDHLVNQELLGDVQIYTANFLPVYEQLLELQKGGFADLQSSLEEDPVRMHGLLKSIPLAANNHNARNATSTLARYINPVLIKDIAGLLAQLQANGVVPPWKMMSQTAGNELWQIEIPSEKDWEVMENIQAVKIYVRNLMTNSQDFQKLSAANVHFFRLLKNLKGFVYHCRNDVDYTMLFMTDSAYDVTGYTTDEFLKGKTVSFAKIIHPEDIEYVQKFGMSTLKDNTQFNLEYRIITKSGEVKWVAERCIAITNETGKIVSFEGSIVDITEKKSADSKLRASEERFRRVFDLSPTAIVLSEFSTGKILVKH